MHPNKYTATTPVPLPNTCVDECDVTFGYRVARFKLTDCLGIVRIQEKGHSSAFGQADGTAAGIVTTQPAAGGLSRWMRTADGAWIGVVTYIATLTDGTTIKCLDQLLPAHALTPR